ncbi:membrane protein [Jannaschia pagri]|uniref:Membrane protein n=1 Tax=Jannaschia pagri TaxID=2829797 RepID=A0ABQ4NHK3_9RHOB|nr:MULTISPECIES: DUF2306 domain-containing protein [unclassified Jannaschia]GIT90004.1 membrane protein [Jannaschia sp. AI_61]GIT93890.1 membrane protein [Jannaschia sp. AI_62]
MDWTPLWQADMPIPPHAMAAFAALGLGAVQFALPKGTLPHRILGWAWVGVMAVVAITSFWIHTFRLIGPFSPIHLLSCLVLVSLVRMVVAARTGNIAAHRRTVIQLYALGLILTGLFTLIPGRVMHGVLFGGA